MTGKRKDANHNEIVQALNAVGGEWIDTTGDPAIGMDGIALFRSRSYFCEIKDGSKTASKKRLTETESKRKAQVERQGLRYHVIESREQLLKLIGAVK